MVVWVVLFCTLIAVADALRGALQIGGYRRILLII
jgi:hypothetical protein